MWDEKGRGGRREGEKRGGEERRGRSGGENWEYASLALGGGTDLVKQRKKTKLWPLQHYSGHCVPIFWPVAGIKCTLARIKCTTLFKIRAIFY